MLFDGVLLCFLTLILKEFWQFSRWSVTCSFGQCREDYAKPAQILFKEIALHSKMSLCNSSCHQYGPNAACKLTPPAQESNPGPCYPLCLILSRMVFIDIIFMFNNSHLLVLIEWSLSIFTIWWNRVCQEEICVIKHQLNNKLLKFLTELYRVPIKQINKIKSALCRTLNVLSSVQSSVTWVKKFTAFTCNLSFLQLFQLTRSVFFFHHWYIWICSKTPSLKYIRTLVSNVLMSGGKAVTLRIRQPACVCALLRIKQERLNQSGVNNSVPPSCSALLCCWECPLLNLWLVKEEDRMGLNTFTNTKRGMSFAANTEHDLKVWHTFFHTQRQRLPRSVWEW